MTSLMNNYDWLYNGQLFDETLIENHQGFVYEIENLETGRKYIGKKFFWSTKTLPVTKTRKRKKKTKVESDWRNYFGSSDSLKEDVANLGREKFKRTILHLCVTKGDCSYLEMKEQIERDVLLKPDEYYNAFVGGKIHRTHLKNLMK